MLTQFEGIIKRNHLSSDFETTEELLSYCALSKGVAYNSARPGFVPHLPWIPQTTAAVALRLLELDASIVYNPLEKPESHEEKKVENFIVEFLQLSASSSFYFSTIHSLVYISYRF